MAINIYEPMRFSSQGIEDLATQPSLTVSNGRITVDVVEPKREIVFSANSLAEVEGRGIKWSDGRRTRGILFKNGGFNSDLSLNLVEEKEYQINNVPVLSFSELGNTVTKSNLKTVGTLKSLKVSGSAEIGDFVFMNSDINRVGINIESPKLVLMARENNIDFGIGSLKLGVGTIGTFTNSALEIVTDSTTRISINQKGDVQVHGKMIVEDLIIEKSSFLLFRETETETNFGKGLIWKQRSGPSKQFVLQAQPDRFHSTDNIDIGKDKHFSINNTMVLNETTLGDGVINSNLTKVGILKELQVAGDVAVTRKIMTNQLEIGRFIIGENVLSSRNEFSIKRAENIDFTISNNITIGNSSNTSRTVSVFGNLAIGVVTPNEDVALTVSGPISFENKKFQIGTQIPTSGNFNKGDIVWNSEPTPGGCIGWVCVTPGTPGAWLPFGLISSR